MRKIILIISILFFPQIHFANSEFVKLKNENVSLLDHTLLKIESKLVQRHTLLGPQMLPVRVQFQYIGSQVDFNEEESKIIISIRGEMDKKRYSQKKYIPKISDCNILRNLLLYGKQGYNIFSKKRNVYLTDSIMSEMFISNFLNNLSITESLKDFILKNTYARVEIIDPVRGNDIFCKGRIAEELQ
tara:strand:- start:523 stop:1083 length:561 start_codon:yes stop_codon:yes gene_type:complete